jgi:hypothetical protein
LEDFARLHLSIDAFREELANGKFKIGLKFRDVEGADPKIKIYKSPDPEGSDSYLKDDQNAFAQLSGENAEALGEVTDGNAMFLPQDFWTGNNAGSKKCLLFEASGEGRGKLVMTINKSNGTQIGEGPSVWLDLKNIKKMYQRIDSAAASLGKCLIRARSARRRTERDCLCSWVADVTRGREQLFRDVLQTALASWV